MDTFEKLLERAKSEKIAIHTPTEEQAKALLSELDKKGYKWGGEDKLTTTTYYEVYKEDTCYSLELGNAIYYSLFTWYQSESYTIIECSDIDFNENK